jgi:hypothetical protein
MDPSHSENGVRREWTANPELVQRTRVRLVVSLSKRSSDELVRILMDWLDDGDLEAFCRAYLDESELRWILNGTAGGG